MSESECDLWVKGLRYLTRDTISASYPLQVERWLWKEFTDININSNNNNGTGAANGSNMGAGGVVTLKDVKAFLLQANCKMGNQRLREAFAEVDTRKSGQLTFDQFAALYQILIHDQQVSRFYPKLLLQYLILKLQ